MGWPQDLQTQVGFHFALGEFRAAVVRRFVVTNSTNGGVGPGVAAFKFWDTYSPLLLNVLTQQAELQGILIWAPPFSGTVVDSFTPEFATFGSGGNDALPPQVSGKIQFRGLRRQIRRLGRAYIPFPSATDNTPAGGPTAGYLTGLQAIADQLLLPLTATDSINLPPVINRLTTFRAHMDPHSTSNPNWLVESSTISKWGSQRRRAHKPLPGTWPFG
jgi:hypothetical protein